MQGIALGKRWYKLPTKALEELFGSRATNGVLNTFPKAGQLLVVCGQPGRRGLSRRCWTPEPRTPPSRRGRAGSRRAHSYQKYVLVYILFHISRSSATAKLTLVPEVAGRELARELARDARFSAAASSSASSFLVLRQQLGHSAGVPCRPFDK